MKNNRIIAGVLGFACLLAHFVSVAAPAEIIEEKNWSSKTVAHKGFTDLGNYVIRLNTFTDPASLANGIAAMNAIYDKGDITKLGCTAMATKNSRGEVIFGRNMDLEISQVPAYIIETTYGKYRTIGVHYTPEGATYAERQKQENLSQAERDALSVDVSDCMNEKGLYVEVNMRSTYDELTNYGLHSKRGENVRAKDGKPWSELRACIICFTQLACQNCATVHEAIEFMKNSYDWYTFASGPFSGWNLAFLMGDATGEYGLLEVARDEVYYIPRQFGHANYYISPVLNALDVVGNGHGRLKKVTEVISGLETLEEAMDAMKPILWRNEVLWVGESVRVADAAHPNPYNQIVFKDDRGNPQIDWRSEHAEMYPVLEDGRLLIHKDMYDQAVASTYDPMIKKYFDDALASGTLVLDDGSRKWFTVNGEKLTLSEINMKSDAYEASEDPEEQKKLLPYYKVFSKYYLNLNVSWCHNDRNFEALKAVVYADFHIRKNADGEFDPNGKSKYEKLKAFHGFGTKKDETPLRDSADIWTTALNIGVNCARKEMKIRFWENDDIIYTVKFLGK